MGILSSTKNLFSFRIILKLSWGRSVGMVKSRNVNSTICVPLFHVDLSLSIISVMAGPDLGFLETVRCPSAVTIWKFWKAKIYYSQDRACCQNLAFIHQYWIEKWNRKWRQSFRWNRKKSSFYSFFRQREPQWASALKTMWPTPEGVC